MKKILLAIGTLTLVSCQHEATETHKNGNFKVEFLFEQDGCKIYRFDDGRTVYWANCAGRIQADYTQSNGKSGNHTVRRETLITE